MAMEIKKTPQTDLERKKALFLGIGFVIALLLVVGAFSYSVRERIVELQDFRVDELEPDLVEITRWEPKPPIAITEIRPRPVKIISGVVDVVDNDTPPVVWPGFEGAFEAADIEQFAAEEFFEEAVVDDFYVSVDVMPGFMGDDLSRFRRWVAAQVVYPVEAWENRITGRVTVQFFVEADGSLEGIEVLESPDPLLSEETVRVIRSSPRWTPGMIGERNVRVKCTVPVDFRM